MRELFDGRAESLHAMKHAVVTWISFAVAGLAPLLPFFFGLPLRSAFWFSVLISAISLFVVGAGRTIITRRSPFLSGLEMLLVGALAGNAAFAAGWIVERVAKGHFN
jgi:VIT1/CCC1 family predicted Fe2+/Mn2+ transporter